MSEVKCETCNEIISIQFYKINGKPYHQFCLMCSVCQKLLNINNFYQDSNGKICCQVHRNIFITKIPKKQTEYSLSDVQFDKFTISLIYDFVVDFRDIMKFETLSKNFLEASEEMSSYWEGLSKKRWKVHKDYQPEKNWRNFFIEKVKLECYHRRKLIQNSSKQCHVIWENLEPTIDHMIRVCDICKTEITAIQTKNDITPESTDFVCFENGFNIEA
eukprot:gene7511-11835_t